MSEKTRDLPTVKQKLDDTISALVDPKPYTVQRDNGPVITWLDSLLDQLLESVSGQTGERSGAQSSVPIWLAVVDLHQQLMEKAVEWHPDEVIGDPLEGRLRAIQDRTWRPQDVPHITRIIDDVARVVAAVQEILSPEPAVYLMAPDTPGPAACTACETRWVMRRDSSDNGRLVRQPALKITSHGCICQACRASWEPGALRMLAQAIGYPVPDGVLE